MVMKDRSGSEVRPDQPLSFAPRRYAPRRIVHEYRRVDMQKAIDRSWQKILMRRRACIYLA